MTSVCLSVCPSVTLVDRDHIAEQEAFEKFWAHSPLRAAARRIAIHQVSLLSHDATLARRLRLDVHDDANDNTDNDNA